MVRIGREFRYATGQITDLSWEYLCTPLYHTNHIAGMIYLVAFKKLDILHKSGKKSCDNYALVE